jgi:hypothetical protein
VIVVDGATHSQRDGVEKGSPPFFYHQKDSVDEIVVLPILVIASGALQVPLSRHVCGRNALHALCSLYFSSLQLPLELSKCPYPDTCAVEMPCTRCVPFNSNPCNCLWSSPSAPIQTRVRSKCPARVVFPLISITGDAQSDAPSACFRTGVTCKSKVRFTYRSFIRLTILALRYNRPLKLCNAPATCMPRIG